MTILLKRSYTGIPLISTPGYILNEIFFLWYNQGHKVSNKVPKGLFALTNAFLIAVASQIAVAQTTKK